MENWMNYVIVGLLLFNTILLFLLISGRGEAKSLRSALDGIRSDMARADGVGREEAARNREELSKNREELNRGLRDSRMEQNNGIRNFQEMVEARLQAIQQENGKKLEEMRVTVDEKLQASVEKRFNESFKSISDRLDLVHRGLGEMQTLANGVGDLKKVLTNVKTRGTLGEIQLGSILEQYLSPDQFLRNASMRNGSQERVEFAVKLPSKGEEDDWVLLPIDSKFPVEDYQRLLEALESTGSQGGADAEAAGKQLELAIKKNAKDIREKYVNPPKTTDFGIMFVPTEGLYSEILRRTGLFEHLQREYKVTVVGPSNLVAFLNSLQMGFRTLAIEKRSSEVWGILGAVKTEFGAFGEILEKTKKKLQEAANVIDHAGTRSRVIERKLRDVESLPREESESLLGEFRFDEEI